MLRLKQTAALVALLYLTGGAARGADLLSDNAGSYKDGPSGYWVVTVGGYAVAQPDYPGSKSYSAAFWPTLDIHRAGERDWLTLPTDAYSVTVFQGANYRFGVAGDYINSRNHDDDSGARGLHDINYTLELGGFAEYYPVPFLRTRVELLQGVTGADGLIANLSADYIFRPDCCWLFTVGPRLQFANTQYESTFFSVDAVESARSGLSTFRASGGLNSAGVDATARYYFNDHFSVRAFADWERLVGDGGDSPIVKLRGSADQFEVGIGAAYRFSWGGAPLK